MQQRRTTMQRRGAIFALALVGAFLGLGGATYELAQPGVWSARPGRDRDSAGDRPARSRPGDRRAIAPVTLGAAPRPVVTPPRPTGDGAPPSAVSEAPGAASPSAPQPTSFTIGGDVPHPLEPGMAVPLDLVLTNPGAAAITISHLDVSVGSVSAPWARATFPCGLHDFSVTQFSGSYGFTLGPSSTRSLSQLGVSTQQLPRVAMLDRPVNQNGCKGASLRFVFVGASAGGTP
jgi:hypothetical protein